MKKPKTKSITVDLSADEFNFIAREAHKKDITFNEMCNEILKEQLEKLENPDELAKFEKFIKETDKLEKAYKKCKNTPVKIPGGIRKKH